MRRFAFFSAALLVLVVIGSQPWNGRALKNSSHSMCVCLPSRAGLILRSITGTRVATTSVAAITPTQAKR